MTKLNEFIEWLKSVHLCSRSEIVGNAVTFRLLSIARGVLLFALISIWSSPLHAAVLCQHKLNKSLKVYSKSCPGAFNKILSTDTFIGPPGADGPQGAQGEQGPQGMQGAQGADGSNGSVTQRRYYLSQTAVTAQNAPSTCSTGYHFASMFELSDPAVLLYDASLGRSSGDGGAGPVSGVYGWVRTGYASYNLSSIGRSNCAGWTAQFGFGSTAALNDQWGASFPVGIWGVGTSICQALLPVWCVQDLT